MWIAAAHHSPSLPIPARPEGGGDRLPTSFSGTRFATEKVRAGVAGTVETILRKAHFQQDYDADKPNGIATRFLVGLKCDAHRVRNGKERAWGDWRTPRHLLFPSEPTVEHKGGRVVVGEPRTLSGFRHGPAR